MGMAFRVDPEDTTSSSRGPTDGPITLSGRVLGQLATAEQLVVWAFREAASDEAAAAERLTRGFRLAFDCQLIGAAACGFDGLRRCLAAEPSLAPRLCPLRCACIGIDEERLLHGLAAAQLGDRAQHDSQCGRFVAPAARLQLWRQSKLFTSAMRRAALVLPDPRFLAPGRAPRLH